MNFITSAALRTASRACIRRAPPSLRAPYSRLTALTPAPRPPPSSILRLANGFQQKRDVASSVSGKPGSQTLEQAATNVKEELGNSATDLAKVIAGGNYSSDNVKPDQQTFLNITNAVAQAVPTPYMVFGLLGSVPYLFCSAATWYLTHEAGMAAAGVVTNIDPGVALTLLDRALNIQMTYGAVMLSFLGAIHWGMEFAGYGGHKGYSRLALGAFPVLWAWPTLALQPTMALVMQWIGFTALWYCDLQATSAGWAPKWYAQYRFYLSILVGSCIIATLGTVSYWGPVAGHGLLTHDLEMIRDQRKRGMPESEGKIPGDVEAVSTGPEGETYIMVRKKQHEEQAKQEQQEQN
ncbi:hypothetical protein EWM64_g9416 [Hericium alpestre]|uniref:Mnn4-regulates the mannosylphosphorylation n=1 Tax=Hericium alpestre TaxID=135208 RepID=A0A4Y9ZKP0_9AGAM|nr:hypothetical protein EWM64_g9416 [Hericium alpestre]